MMVRLFKSCAPGLPRALVLSAALGALVACPVPAVAQCAPPAATVALATGGANINITPRRVIFSRNKRAEAIYLFNQGNAVVTVDVALIDNVMLPSGELVPVNRIAEKGPVATETAKRVVSAKLMLLATPSRLTLAPGQGKTIRVRALMPATGEAAEYRTHLTVSTVPPADTGLTAEQAAATEKGELVLRIQSIFGISIPLIVRSGEVSAVATLGHFDLAEDAGKPVLALSIGRQGGASVYGNLQVIAGKSETVGFVRGLGVYPEISERAARIPLTRPLRKGETVTVTYFDDDAGPGKAFARESFTAP